jgi:hypothetical protein
LKRGGKDGATPHPCDSIPYPIIGGLAAFFKAEKTIENFVDAAFFAGYNVM